MPVENVLLQSYPGLRTGDPDEMCAWLAPIYAVKLVKIPRYPAKPDFVFNHCRLPSLDLTFAGYGAPFKADIEQLDYFVQGFPLAGRGKVKWNRRDLLVSPEAGGVLAAPGSSGTLDYMEQFSTLALKISPRMLARKLSALTGVPVEPGIRLIGSTNPRFLARQRRLALFLANEAEHCAGNLHDPVIAELEEAVIVNYLLECRHNHSSLLERRQPSLAPWQVRRAADYMEQHCNQPITIEVLTRITESSASSLFQLFRKTYDMSPMVYLSKVRLRRARELLSRPEPGTSVTKVGFMCGFSNMGNFAVKYHAAFGEKPSETLRRSR